MLTSVILCDIIERYIKICFLLTLITIQTSTPTKVSVPLVFQSFTEWQNSQLGLHPVQALSCQLGSGGIIDNFCPRVWNFDPLNFLCWVGPSYPVDYSEKHWFWEFSWECIRQRSPALPGVCVPLNLGTNTTTTGPKRFLSLLGSWELVAFKSSNFGRWHCKWVCQRSMVPLNLWSFPDVMVRVDAPFPCRCWLGVAGRQLMSRYHHFFFRTWWDNMTIWRGVETSRLQPSNS